MAQLAWTSNPKSFISVVSGLKPISLFGGQLTISAETVVTIIACIVIMVVLIWFVNNTPRATPWLCRRIAAPPG